MKLALLLAAALLPAVAAAEPAPPYPPQAESASAPPGAGQRDPDMWARREARMQALRAALRLRPDQEDAFRAYLEALRPDPAMRERMRAERERMASLTAEQREAARAARAPEREAMMQRRRDATERFLARLTPEQQAAFRAAHEQRREHFGGDGQETPPVPPAG